MTVSDTPMKQMQLPSLVLLALLFLALSMVRPVLADLRVPAGWTAGTVSTVSNRTKIRGYGPVTAKFLTLQDKASGQSVVVSTFNADSASHALTIVSKYLADLTLSPGVTVSSLTAAKRQFRLISVATGDKYTGCVVGHSGYVLAAAKAEELQRLLGAEAAFAGPTVVTGVTKYPMYLDRFDRFGWGFYSFADAENDWHSNVLADEDWCAKHGFRYELYLQPGGFNGESFGISDIPQTRWKVDEAKKRGLAIAAHLYGAMPTAPAYSDGFEQPAPFLETGWYNWSYDCKTQPHMSWLDPEGRDYYARQTGEQMQLLVNEPNQTAWLSPFAENGGDGWYDLNNDFSPAATANWRSTLQGKRLSLSPLSAMYNRPPDAPFHSWGEVPVPEFATFAGLSRQVVDLTGPWAIRQEKTADEGIAGQWWNADVTSPEWTTITMPGSDLFRQFDKHGPNTGNNPTEGNKWCLRDFSLTANQLAHSPLYLYTFLRPDAGNDKLPAPMYVNGQFVGNASGWDAMDVTSLLKPGPNRLALRTNVFNGRVFLSTEQPSYFPHLSPERNRLWMLWREWYYRSMYDDTRETFDVMRKVDPNRPIKCMAPDGYGITQFYDLAEHYGALGHFTGEGVWMFPWEKRYGYLYDVPGSSEGAGPQGDVRGCFLSMDRVFLEGLNGHEEVFEAQNYIDNAPLRAWYEAHTAVLRQLGRYDIAGPQIILYRSTTADQYGGAGAPAHAPQQNRTIQYVYDWDIERGAAQAAGQSCLYLDDGSLREGKMNPYKVMVDCGNELVNPQSLALIQKWVAKGGTYVTWPFTGRGTITNTDSWPITRLTGCGIAKVQATGTGSVTISKGQPYLRALAGKTFPDDGKSINSDHTQENKISVELKRAPGSEVIGRFEDGTPAIVVRHVGKGRIVILGSAFFRNSQDIMGVWQPQQNEIDFWSDLMRGLGQPAVNTTNDRGIWSQRYRMNNGLDDVVVLNNFADADRTVRLKATVGRVPSAVYAVRMNSVTPIPFHVSGHTVTISDIAIPKDEVQVYLFRTHDPADSAQHWWTYQQKMWHAVTPITAPLTKPARHWSDPAVDLTHGWQWTQALAQGVDWTGANVHDAHWARYDLSIMNFAGADPKKPVYLRRHFLVPAQWLHDAAVTRLVQGIQLLDGTQAQLYLNGQQLRDWNRDQGTEMDISSRLHAGDNVLAVALRPGTGPYLGVSGTTFLMREPAPSQIIDLAGVYQNHDKSGPATVTLPGTVTAAYPTRSFLVPADWAGKYIVTCHLTPGPGGGAPGGVFVNEHYVRNFGSIRPDVEVDVTRQLVYGADNTFSPAESMGALLDPVAFNLAEIELRLYPKGSYEKFASVGGMAKPVETRASDLP